MRNFHYRKSTLSSKIKKDQSQEKVSELQINVLHKNVLIWELILANKENSTVLRAKFFKN